MRQRNKEVEPLIMKKFMDPRDLSLLSHYVQFNLEMFGTVGVVPVGTVSIASLIEPLSNLKKAVMIYQQFRAVPYLI